MFLITAVFPLLIIISAILLDEMKFSSQDNNESIEDPQKDMEFGSESNIKIN